MNLATRKVCEIMRLRPVVRVDPDAIPQSVVEAMNRPGKSGGYNPREEEAMQRQGRYPAEVRERAVRLVQEHQHEYPSQWAAITSIATKCGMTAETLRKWVRRAEVDAGGRSGLTSDERQQLVRLERENRELRRANEILKAASAFFARELDPRLPK